MDFFLVLVDLDLSFFEFSFFDFDLVAYVILFVILALIHFVEFASVRFFERLFEEDVELL